MLKWIFKKLGYVHHSELDHHHCNCCNLRSSWHLISKYYDKAMLDNLEDSLVYGAGMTTGSSGGNGSQIVWNRLPPKKVYKKGTKRGKSKKASRSR